MRRLKPRRIARKRGEEGYALVLIMFLLALVVLAVVSVAPDVLTSGTREREQEMIWRGKQYARGVRLYARYAQTHGGIAKFPTTLEDLTTNKTGRRFMRQAYKDPMNPTDGSWRLIYVGPNGQLIGSLKNRPVGGNGVLSGGNAGIPGANGGQSGSQFSSGGSSFGNSSFGNGANSGGLGGQNGAGSAIDQQQLASSGDQSTDPHPLDPSGGQGQLVGGSIIGVGSKINKKSIIWYESAKNYRQFEFIWDPSKQPINGGTVATIGGPPQLNGSPAGTSGLGTPAFGNGINGPNGAPVGVPLPGGANPTQNPSQP